MPSKRFHSYQDLYDFLEGEAAERGMQRCMSIYKIQKSSKRIWMQCKICSSHLNFKRDFQKECFITMTVNRQHNHSAEQIRISKHKLEKREQQCKASRENWKKRIEQSRQGTRLEELSAIRALKTANAKRAYEIKMEHIEESQRRQGKEEESKSQVRFNKPPKTPVMETNDKENPAQIDLRSKKRLVKSPDPPVKIEEGLDNRSAVKVGKVEKSKKPVQTSALNQTPARDQQTTPAEAPSPLSLIDAKAAFKVNMFWSQSSRDKFPNSATFISEKMVSNMDRFGDLVYLTQVPNLTIEAADRAYQLLILSVCDSNMRPLLVGAAIFDQTVVSPIYKMLRAILAAHRIKPLSLVSDDSPQLAKGIKELRDAKLFAGSHLLHPLSVITETTQHLRGKPCEIFRLKQKLLQAATTRDKHQFSELVKELQENEYSSVITQHLLQNKASMFYCLTEKAYVGLGRNSSKEVGGITKLHFSQKQPLSEFSSKLIQLERILNQNSEESFEPFKGGLEIHMKDQRLQGVISCFEQAVVERFVQNYLLALRSCAVEETKHRVVVSMHGDKYKINAESWGCECLEQEKTGVACCHLIAATISSESREYTSLISGTWKRERK